MWCTARVNIIRQYLLNVLHDSSVHQSLTCVEVFHVRWKSFNFLVCSEVEEKVGLFWRSTMTELCSFTFSYSKTWSRHFAYNWRYISIILLRLWDRKTELRILSSVCCSEWGLRLHFPKIWTVIPWTFHPSMSSSNLRAVKNRFLFFACTL